MPPPITPPKKKPSQAALVSAWLGTYELLVSDTIRVVDIGGRRQVVQTPSPDAIAAAATILVQHMDLEQPVFVGVGNNLSPLDESVQTRMERAGITFSPEDVGRG